MKSLLHSSSFPLSISFHSLYNLKKSHAVNLKKWPNETHTVMKISKTLSTIKKQYYDDKTTYYTKTVVF